MLENEIEVVEMEDIGRGRDAAIGLYKGSTNIKSPHMFLQCPHSELLRAPN